MSFSEKEFKPNTNPLYSLFKIERSKDANQILYDVNLSQTGRFNENEPITVYWKKNTRGGKIEPLTWIQKKYAYGLKYLNINDEYATFKFVSYDKMLFTLKKINNKFEVYTKYNNKLLKMERIFIQLDGGTFWFPNVKAIEIYAKDVKTGKEVIDIINP